MDDMNQPEYMPSPARPGYYAKIVPWSDLLTEHEAAKLLRRPRLMIGLYVNQGVVEAAATRQPDRPQLVEGVTRESVERELAWRATAGPTRKLLRSIKWIISFV